MSSFLNLTQSQVFKKSRSLQKHLKSFTIYLGHNVQYPPYKWQTTTMLDIISLFLKHLIQSEFLASLCWKRLLLLTKDRPQEPFVYLLELNLFTAVENQDYSTLLLSLGKNSVFLFAVPTPPSQEIMLYIHTRFVVVFTAFLFSADLFP